MFNENAFHCLDVLYVRTIPNGVTTKKLPCKYEIQPSVKCTTTKCVRKNGMDETLPLTQVTGSLCYIS